MAAHFLKQHVNHGNYYGSAIVYWYEARGCPPGVKALPLTSIEPLELGTGVSEKTLCNARYRGQLYRCVVLWIEEDKTPDELVLARLVPTSNERIFEEKGYRWARELQMQLNDNAKSDSIDAKQHSSSEERETGFANQEELNGEGSKEHGESTSETDDHKSFEQHASNEEESMVFPEDPLDVNPSSPPYDSSIASASSGTFASHPLFRPHLNGSSQSQQGQKQGRKQKAPTKAFSMIPTPVLSTPRNIIPHPASVSPARSRSPLMNDMDDDDDLDDFKTLPSTSAADTTSLGISADALVQRMCLEASWTKALRCAMRELFTGDELATSLPHQSKSGMNVLDPHRLAIAKDLLSKYCASKDIPLPSRRHVSQALHNCLISSRTSKFRMKKFANLSSKAPSFDFMNVNGHLSLPRETKFRPIGLPR